jgi:hypothetical protein
MLEAEAIMRERINRDEDSSWVAGEIPTSLQNFDQAGMPATMLPARCRRSRQNI